LSQFLPEQSQKVSDSKGPEAYLSSEERKALQRSLSFPEDLPPKFRSWLIDFIAVNIPQIPISQIVGAQQFGFKLLDSAQITSTVRVDNTSEAGPDTIISGTAVQYDGKPIMIYVNVPKLVFDGSGRNLTINLWEDGVDKGRVASASSGVSELSEVFTMFHRFTPAPGGHTYSIRGWISAGWADFEVGVGGVGVERPGQLTIFAMPE
jgi:hypothetical protein